MLVGEAHVVLLRLVAREEPDPIRHADLTGEEPTKEHVAKRAVPPVIEHTLSRQHATARDVTVGSRIARKLLEHLRPGRARKLRRNAKA